MSAPTGETISYQVDGESKHILIKPNVLCDRNLKEVSALIKEQKRNRQKERQELLKALKELPPEAVSASVSEIVKDSLEDSKRRPDYTDIFEQLMNPDGVALRMVLKNSSEGDVEELLEHHPNAIEIMTTTISAAMETLQAVEKNLESLGLTEAEPLRSRTSPENNSTPLSLKTSISQ